MPPESEGHPRGTTEDLPVAVCLRQPLAGEVTAWVEGELGWQVVPAQGPPRPAVVIRDLDDIRSGCVAVTAGDVDAATLRVAMDAGARDALGWPADRDRLSELARHHFDGTAELGPAVWRIAGAGGGVGTSTVTLAVAGLAGWTGRSAVVVGGDDLLALCGLGPWRGPGVAEVVGLGPVDGPAELEGLARPVAGVDGVAVLGGGVPEPLEVAGWPVDLVVVDGGIAGGRTPDPLVTSADARAANARGVAAPLLVVGDGPLGARGIRALAGRRPVGWLPTSARVARAALAGRVPAGLPGTWLRALREALGRVRST